MQKEDQYFKKGIQLCQWHNRKPNPNLANLNASIRFNHALYTLINSKLIKFNPHIKNSALIIATTWVQIELKTLSSGYKQIRELLIDQTVARKHHFSGDVKTSCLFLYLLKQLPHLCLQKKGKVYNIFKWTKPFLLLRKNKNTTIYAR